MPERKTGSMRRFDLVFVGIVVWTAAAAGQTPAENK
jgi:hypothetical protein